MVYIVQARVLQICSVATSSKTKKQNSLIHLWVKTVVVSTSKTYKIHQGFKTNPRTLYIHLNSMCVLVNRTRSWINAASVSLT